MRPSALHVELAPERSGGDSELGAMALWGSWNWGHLASLLMHLFFGCSFVRLRISQQRKKT